MNYHADILNISSIYLAGSLNVHNAGMSYVEDLLKFLFTKQ